jgi:hypothetical protein
MSGERSDHPDKKSNSQGISLDEKAQEQPTDKARARQASRKDRGGDPPGEKEPSNRK